MQLVPRSRGPRPIAVVLALAAAVAACGGAGSGAASPRTNATRTTVPGATWSTATPRSVGLDAQKLGEIGHVAEQGKSTCLVVERHGKLAHEQYFRGTNAASAQDIYSATKSITSTLVGIAVDDGKLRIDDSASKWIPEWKGTPAAAVTIRDLLSNDSGREWSPMIDYVQLLRASDRTAFAIGLPQAHPPGEVWAYNNSAIQTLQQVLQRATGADLVAFAKQRLFDPLGMTDTTMTTDRAGNAQTFEGVRSTCRDLARFGLLMLDDGQWGNHRIVSARWVHEATGRSSTKLNAAYGYLWWLNRRGLIGSPLVATDLSAAANPTTTRGRLVADAPPDIFWALGLGNQIVQVDPGSKTVVVRLGTGEPRPKPPTFGPAEASRVVTDAVTR